jgi:arginine exporter protein ArgO
MFYFVFFTLCAALAGGSQVLLFKVFVLTSGTWRKRHLFLACVSFICSILVTAMAITSLVQMVGGPGYQTLAVLWLGFVVVASAWITHHVFKR